MTSELFMDCISIANFVLIIWLLAKTTITNNDLREFKEDAKDVLYGKEVYKYDGLGGTRHVPGLVENVKKLKDLVREVTDEVYKDSKWRWLR